MIGEFGFGDLSMLPMCVLKDEMVDGKRVGVVAVNDIFKPTPKVLPRTMAGEYVFTKYHFHDGIEILRIHKGEATAVINNRTFAVKSGDLLIINPYEAHSIYLNSPDVPFCRSCVIFKPQDIFPSGKGGTLFDGLRTLRFKNHIDRGCKSEGLVKRLDRIVEIAECAGVARSVEEIAALIEFYSAAISEGAVTDSDNSAPYRREFVTRISDRIGEVLPGEITTAEAADYCKYSTEHFCRLFKECFGETFKDYVNSCRIKIAKDKIDEEEQYSVSELALSAGFGSTNHFTAMFTRHLGLTPSEYIKKKRGKIK